MLDNIKEIHIEPTSVCNAACPMCARNINGKGLNPYITLKSLPVAWFRENTTPEQVRKLDKIFFCGNVGDPASAPELLEIIQYFKKHNPNIVVGLNSNAGLKTAMWWNKLGHLLDGPLDYCIFSIDGTEDTNHLYRRNVRWQKVMENAESFISTGASAHWDMLVFEHNKHEVDEAKQIAKKMRFTWFRSKETDRWDTYVSNLGIFPANKYQPPSYGRTIDCEKDRDASIYLDYTGKYWPCCHMAEAYLNKIGIELHTDIREYNNKELFKEYKVRLNTETPFYICKRACGTEGKRSQWKTEEQLR
jgi:MoaA/NifB/PqqE/SkfB family radical SAM enzyme